MYIYVPTLVLHKPKELVRWVSLASLWRISMLTWTCWIRSSRVSRRWLLDLKQWRMISRKGASFKFGFYIGYMYMIHFMLGLPCGALIGTLNLQLSIYYENNIPELWLAITNDLVLKSHSQFNQPLRLSNDLKPFVSSMAASYRNLAGFMTDLKMEHRDGELKSDALTELLGL